MQLAGFDSGSSAARRMLDFARTLGVTEGVSYFRLDCAADNAPLTQIYRTYEFDHVGQKDFPEFSVALMQVNLNDHDAAGSGR